ncbi:MAG: biosynthetic arginine decarboxylase [Oligoflexia bacterium]|nr:biosynthetic arginine decarboxylase [Oligoflexia bacterium]
MHVLPSNGQNNWTADQASEHYSIESWSAGYFSVNDKGHMCVYPQGRPGPNIDIMDVVDDIREKGLKFPCVIRFQDILRNRVKVLNEAFIRAIQENSYTGRYFGVYPIKVNQMAEVVEEIVDAGQPYHYGLEAGSKGELLVVLGLNTDPEAITVCNGYKDEEFMRLALLGRKLGRKVVVVIEKLSELPLLIKVAQDMGVEPMIGLRAKLSTKGIGKWESSSGDFAKFGLTIPELIKAVEIVKQAKLEHAVNLFHFHVGSQLTNIRTIKEAVGEGGRIYAHLKKMGLNITYFDVGGGLGVDYLGSRTAALNSMNYTVEEYASDIVYNLKQICANEGVSEPHLVSESGRAITAHHACIVMNVFGKIEVGGPTVLPPALPGEPPIVKELREIVSGLNGKNARESFHDAVAKKEEAMSMFRFGILSLEDRAKVETLYWQLCRDLVQLNKRLKNPAKDTRDLGDKIADQYMANFSLFQSAPDHWAFDQLFPIVPLHRLDEVPTRNATLVDITCDSDGKIDRFVERADVCDTISLHTLREGEPYYVGMFMTGAYQDIMGDMHNLFGKVNEVHIFVDDEDPEDFYIEEVIPGDTIEAVLSQVQYEPKELARKVKFAIDNKIREGALKPKEGVSLTDFYESVMKDYTYLSNLGVNQ